jgi:hypothetical protein
MNQPEPQCPAAEKTLSPNIFDHQDAFSNLHPIEVRLTHSSFYKTYGVFLVFFSFHNFLKFEIWISCFVFII